MQFCIRCFGHIIWKFHLGQVKIIKSLAIFQSQDYCAATCITFYLINIDYIFSQKQGGKCQECQTNISVHTCSLLLIFVPLKRDFPTKSALKSIRCSEFDQSINFPFEGALKGLQIYCVFWQSTQVPWSSRRNGINNNCQQTYQWSLGYIEVKYFKKTSRR